MKQPLMQLFARARAGEADLDILVRHQSREPDHLLRQIEDADRLSHVEHANTAGMALVTRLVHRCGLKHQRHRLAHGHEVTGHLGMGDGHRPAAGDLTLEQRNNRPCRS